MGGRVRVGSHGNLKPESTRASKNGFRARLLDLLRRHRRATSRRVPVLVGVAAGLGFASGWLELARRPTSRSSPQHAGSWQAGSSSCPARGRCHAGTGRRPPARASRSKLPTRPLAAGEGQAGLCGTASGSSECPFTGKLAPNWRGPTGSPSEGQIETAPSGTYPGGRPLARGILDRKINRRKGACCNPA